MSREIISYSRNRELKDFLQEIHLFGNKIMPNEPFDVLLPAFKECNCKIYSFFQETLGVQVLKDVEKFRSLDFFIFIAEDSTSSEIDIPILYDRFGRRFNEKIAIYVPKNSMCIVRNFARIEEITKKKTGFLLGVEYAGKSNPSFQIPVFRKVKGTDPEIKLFPLGSKLDFTRICNDPEKIPFMFVLEKRISYEILNKRINLKKPIREFKFPAEIETFGLNVKESFWGKELIHQYKDKYLSTEIDFFTDTRFPLSRNFAERRNADDSPVFTKFTEEINNAFNEPVFLEDWLFEEDYDPIGTRVVPKSSIGNNLREIFKNLLDYEEMVVNAIFNDTRFEKEVEMHGFDHRDLYSRSGKFFVVMGTIGVQDSDEKTLEYFSDEE